MKKSLLAVLLAVALVAPVFAAKGDMSVNTKLGLGVNNNLSFYVDAFGGPDTVFYESDMEMPFSIGAEFFYGLMDNLSVGLGVNYGFDSKTKGTIIDGPKIKAGTTNIYAAIKPEVKIESDIFSSLYLIGQVGLAMGRAEFDDSYAPSLTVNSGLYLGFGIGTTIKDCVIVELVCSSANLTIDNKDHIFAKDANIQYTATTINVGYKFAL